MCSKEHKGDNSPQNADTENIATITIVGGGFTGITIAIQQLWAWQHRRAKNPDTPALNIRILDKNGSFGPGAPYDHQTNVLLLNQPAYAMSPFNDDPDHFTRWLKNYDAHSDENTFASRHTYGLYLKEIFKSAVNAEPNITIECEQAEAATINYNKHAARAFTITSKDGALYNSDSVIIADGHQQSPFLSALNDEAGFFSAPYSTQDVKNKLRHDKSAVLIIGTGQSMMDALATLDHIGYEGQIYAASRNLVLPWAFHPENYKSALPPYEFKVLTTAQKINAETIDELLEQEFKSAKERGYDIGHVLGAYNEKELKGSYPESALKKLTEKIKALYGNPTPPQRFELLNKYLDTGRLTLISADIKEGSISKSDDLFTFAAGTGLEDLLPVSAVFNGAAYARSAVLENGKTISPLLRDAFAKHLLHAPQNGVFAEGEQTVPGLYINGPATSHLKWGVETFRAGNKLTAEQSVNHALNTSPKPISKIA